MELSKIAAANYPTKFSNQSNAQTVPATKKVTMENVAERLKALKDAVKIDAIFETPTGLEVRRIAVKQFEEKDSELKDTLLQNYPNPFRLLGVSSVMASMELLNPDSQPKKSAASDSGYISLKEKCEQESKLSNDEGKSRELMAKGTPTAWIVHELLGGDVNRRHLIDSVTASAVTDGRQVFLEFFQMTEKRTITTKKCLMLFILWQVTLKDGSQHRKILPFYTGIESPSLGDLKASINADWNIQELTHGYINIHRATVDLDYAKSVDRIDCYNNIDLALESGRVINGLVLKELSEKKTWLYMGRMAFPPTDSFIELLWQKWMPIYNLPNLTNQHQQLYALLELKPADISATRITSEGIALEVYRERLRQEIRLQQQAFKELEKEMMAADEYGFRSLQRVGLKFLPFSLANSVPSTTLYEKQRSSLETKLSSINERMAKIKMASGENSSSLVSLVNDRDKIMIKLKEKKHKYESQLLACRGYSALMNHLVQSIERHTQQLLKLSEEPTALGKSNETENLEFRNALKSNAHTMKDLSALLAAAKIDA